MKKKKSNLSDKDISNIFLQALEMIEKLDDSLEDLVEFSCNLKLLLRKVKNKMNSGLSLKAPKSKEIKEPPKKEEVALDELLILDANDLDLLDGNEEL